MRIRTLILSLLVWGAQATEGLAHGDIVLLTTGRTSYPKSSWTTDYNVELRSPDFNDPSGDLVQHTLDIETGWTDRLSLGLGVSTESRFRNSFALDRAVLEGRYRLLDDPVQFTPLVEILPSLKGGMPGGEIGFEALKNWGSLAFLLPVEMELSEEEGETWEVHTEVGAEAVYRFGLNGLVGAEYRYATEGEHSAYFVFGGRVAKVLFLGFEPKIGLNGKAPDFGFLFQLDLYFGPYVASGLD